MNWSELRDLVHQSIAWIVSYTRVAKSSAGGSDDEVEGRSAPDEPSYQIPVRRMWPFGLRTRPPAGVEAVVVLVNGGATRAVMVGAESAKYGPSNLEEGESALYCIADGCVVKLDKDGSVTVTAKNGAKIAVNQDGSITHDSSQGKDIVLNGGSHKVARVGAGDKTESHDHHVTFNLTAPQGGGAVTGTITVQSHAGLAITDGGADHVKA